MAFLFDDLVVWIGKKVKEMADEELYGSSEKIQEELQTLQARLDMGELTEEEYQQKEEEILERLKIAREKEEEKEN